MNVPALIRILFVFSMVLVLNRLKWHLSLALLVGSMVLSLWFGHGVTGSLEILFRGALSLDTILLLAIIFQILSLAMLMNGTGMMERMIRSVRAIVPSRRMALAMLPAMIGFLPMPGGAAVSAPLVDAADEEGSVEPLQKTAINYWFRHAWEYWWPLYPGVLLAFEISGLSLARFAAVEVPLTFFAILSGSLFLLLPLKLGPRKRRPEGKARDLFFSFFPILLLICLWAGLGYLLAGILGDGSGGGIWHELLSARYFPMFLALILVIAYVHIAGRADRTTWKEVFSNKKSFLLLLVVIGIKVFSYALETPLPDGGRIVEQVNTDLEQIHVPEILIVAMIPFISGFVTGLALGFVGASFPIIIALAGQDAPTAQIMSYVVLAYGFGHMGMMLSPVHICFLVTNEYFETSMVKAYRKLWGPVFGVFVGAILISWLAWRFG